MRKRRSKRVSRANKYKRRIVGQPDGELFPSLAPLKYFLRHFPEWERRPGSRGYWQSNSSRVCQVSPLDTVKTLFETLSSACCPRPWNKRAKFWIFSSFAFSQPSFGCPNATGPPCYTVSFTNLEFPSASAFLHPSQLPRDSNTNSPGMNLCTR